MVGLLEQDACLEKQAVPRPVVQERQQAGFGAMKAELAQVWRRNDAQGQERLSAVAYKEPLNFLHRTSA